MSTTDVRSDTETGTPSFDSIELIGHVMPVLFAIMAFVAAAMAPETSEREKPAVDPKKQAVIEQIHHTR